MCEVVYLHTVICSLHVHVYVLVVFLDMYAGMLYAHLNTYMQVNHIHLGDRTIITAIITVTIVTTGMIAANNI